MPLALAPGPTAKPLDASQASRTQPTTSRVPACTTRLRLGSDPRTPSFALSEQKTICGVLVKGFGVESGSGRRAGKSRRREAVDGAEGETKIAQEADKALQAAVASEDLPDPRRSRSEVHEGGERIEQREWGRGSKRSPVIQMGPEAHAGSGPRGMRGSTRA
ncbi:hypothetical protein DFH11DRAFT_1626523 [Phellopilus nigrolimitatus]|nr:hypothetical protein DFH11DRAFT_1654150 [Phellopilus nigrolimitatus]KAH8109696.1 hypothetical protein DFH11DRAFT_1626523 [Phellopilus nigrolimitatus]